ncbi:hypothetical protein Thi970DRAFT_03525 [Thiorhodovibrio frisius]|uniref:Uncharacterized protein n=1 Tax=Thiorhodovibrio frisius TaxID=631362 RepID=H8Z7R6_9GAMM|nr:hypothetical protein Thi970DRAFT_03525 [Thiorhodovibrio frisius]WPL20647.1 hypothetical protein Thiofri_00746 [Thiorhodovibrio frisius]
MMRACSIPHRFEIQIQHRADLTQPSRYGEQATRLIALLEAHGIQWRQPTEPASPVSERETPRLSTGQKVALFRRLFRGVSVILKMALP